MPPPFYRIVRVRPNGTEQVVRDILWTDLTNTQVERAQAFADADQRKAQGLHIRVYSSQDDGTIGPGDLIWDSDIQY